MALPLPKPDKRTIDAIQRVKFNADFKLLVEHQKAMLSYWQHRLMALDPVDVQRAQGRALELQDFLDLLDKTTP